MSTVISTVTRKKFNSSQDTLCVNCASFYQGPGKLCSFFDIENPEEGIAAVGAEAIKTEITYYRNKAMARAKGLEPTYPTYTVYSYKIIKCPNYACLINHEVVRSGNNPKWKPYKKGGEIMNLACDICGKQTYSAAELKHMKVKVCEGCGGIIKEVKEVNREGNKEKTHKFKPRCPYMSCLHHFKINLIGRCRLGLRHRHNQDTCEEYQPKEQARKLPVWYEKYQKEERL